SGIASHQLPSRDSRTLVSKASSSTRKNSATVAASSSAVGPTRGFFLWPTADSIDGLFPLSLPCRLWLRLLLAPVCGPRAPRALTLRGVLSGPLPRVDLGHALTLRGVLSGRLPRVGHGLSPFRYAPRPSDVRGVYLVRC